MFCHTVLSCQCVILSDASHSEHSMSTVGINQKNFLLPLSDMFLVKQISSYAVQYRVHKRLTNAFDVVHYLNFSGKHSATLQLKHEYYSYTPSSIFSQVDRYSFIQLYELEQSCRVNELAHWGIWFKLEFWLLVWRSRPWATIPYGYLQTVYRPPASSSNYIFHKWLKTNLIYLHFTIFLYMTSNLKDQ